MVELELSMDCVNIVIIVSYTPALFGICKQR